MTANENLEAKSTLELGSKYWSSAQNHVLHRLCGECYELETGWDTVGDEACALRRSPYRRSWSHYWVHWFDRFLPSTLDFRLGKSNYMVLCAVWFCVGSTTTGRQQYNNFFWFIITYWWPSRWCEQWQNDATNRTHFCLDYAINSTIETTTGSWMCPWGNKCQYVTCHQSVEVNVRRVETITFTLMWMNQWPAHTIAWTR